MPVARVCRGRDTRLAGDYEARIWNERTWDEMEHASMRNARTRAHDTKICSSQQSGEYCRDEHTHTTHEHACTRIHRAHPSLRLLSCSSSSRSCLLMRTRFDGYSSLSVRGRERDTFIRPLTHPTNPYSMSAREWLGADKDLSVKCGASRD